MQHLKASLSVCCPLQVKQVMPSVMPSVWGRRRLTAPPAGTLRLFYLQECITTRGIRVVFYSDVEGQVESHSLEIP